MQVIYASQAQADIDYWQKYDLKIVRKINKLIEDIQVQPFNGLGKPEPLRFNKAGYWSRRISQEHRLVYKTVGNDLYIAQCRYHY